MSKHTPGPWRMEVDHLKGYRVVGYGATPTMSGNCELADACLIAAAPEMLEMLKALQKQIATIHVYLPELDELIAKAEGRE